MASPREDESRHYHTIIIGAGMSGLACAARLSDDPSYQKDKRLLVLEARDRTGGRIGSVRVNGNRLDTGANWIHGVGTEDEPNPLLQFLPDKNYRELDCNVSFRPRPAANAAGKAFIETQTEHDWIRIDSSIPASHSGEQGEDFVIPPEISSKLLNTLWTLIGSLHERALETSAKEGKDISMLQAVLKDEHFRRAFDNLPEEYHQTLKALPQVLEVMEAGPLAAQSAEHEVDHPGIGLLEFALNDFDGEQVFLRDGYTNVVETVGKKVIEQGNVKLCVEVQNIFWDADPIIVSTCNGPYTAKNVICTVPLGVLQHHQRSPEANTDNKHFFVPALPASKTEAIKSLGFGTLDKIFLVYSRPWWKEEPYLSILKKGFVNAMPGNDDECSGTDTDEPTEPDSLWGFTDELPGIQFDSDGKVSSGVSILSVINLHDLTGFPVLSAFVSCSNAIHVEGLSDAAAGLIVHRSLTNWLGCEPPRPDAVHVTRWAQDEYSRGSYSHMITGLSEKRHREAFVEPLVNVHGATLRFAGEHTSTNHFGTVHGALLSGRREAEAVLKSDSRADG